MELHYDGWLVLGLVKLWEFYLSYFRSAFAVRAEKAKAICC